MRHANTQDTLGLLKTKEGKEDPQVIHILEEKVGQRVEKTEN